MKPAPALKQPRHRHRWQGQRPLALPAGGIAALPALTLLAILAVLVWVGLRPLATPAVVPATAPATTFSAERAMTHLRVIAAQPHAIGSPENAAVRQYLVEQVRALGLEPEIQTTSQAVAEGEEAFRAGVVDNIIVRVPGMRSTGAIAIDAHYDSVNTGPGAGDCGSCVVTALEALRAVVAGPALQNDLLFVFSDGEERHMLGAAAFNQQHPLAGDVRLALNFEAQGSGGPAFLYVTSPDDRWLVSQFLAVAPDASAYSLLASISDLYPAGRFDSDLGWYTERGSQGLGVIFTADTPAYHTDRDNPNVIDPGSIQQEGAYTLALARHFGNLDLTTMPAAAGDSVFFTVWPGVVVHYPFSWTLPLAAVITVLVAGLLFLGFRRQELTSGGLVLGLVSFVTGSLVTVLAATGIWFAVRTLNGAYQVHMAGSYQSGLYQVALILTSIALMTGFYTLLGRKVRRHNLVAGALLGWTLLLWLLSLTVPGISYLATWPLLFALLPPAWSALACSRASQPWWQVLILAIAAVPALVLLPGTLHQMAALINRFEGVLDFPLLGIVMVVVAPLLALFLPHLHFLAGDPGGPRRWAVPAATALVALALIGWGNATSGFDATHPRPDRLAYVLDVDSGQARWVSPDRQLDDWTRQFFPANAAPVDYSSLLGTTRAYTNPAPVVALAPPEAAVERDATSDAVRQLELRLSSPRGVTEMTTVVRAPGEIVAAAVDGRPLDLSAYPDARRGELRLIYADVQPAGWRLELSVRASAPIRTDLEEATDGLPAVSGMTIAPRPADTMPAFDYPRDPTIVTRSLSF